MKIASRHTLKPLLVVAFLLPCTISCSRSRSSRGLTHLTHDLTWCVSPSPELRLAREGGEKKREWHEWVRPGPQGTLFSIPLEAVGYIFVKNELRAVHYYVSAADRTRFRDVLLRELGPPTVADDPSPNWVASDNRTMGLLFDDARYDPSPFLELSYIPSQRRAPK